MTIDGNEDNIFNCFIAAEEMINEETRKFCQLIGGFDKNQDFLGVL